MEADNDARVATIGSWVKVREEGDDEHEVLYLVEGRFANLAENKLHPDNTTSRALAGARAGDEVCMQAPAGTVKFTVVEVGREDLRRASANRDALSPGVETRYLRPPMRRQERS